MVRIKCATNNQKGVMTFTFTGSRSLNVKWTVEKKDGSHSDYTSLMSPGKSQNFFKKDDVQKVTAWYGKRNATGEFTRVGVIDKTPRREKWGENLVSIVRVWSRPRKSNA